MQLPYGVLAVNLTGCFLIGFLARLADTRGIFTSEARLLVFVGIPGGFTSFSCFGSETIDLPRAGALWNALANIGANVIFGLMLVWLGRTATGWMVYHFEP